MALHRWRNQHEKVAVEDFDRIVHGSYGDTAHFTWCGLNRHMWTGGDRGYWATRMWDVELPVTCLECIATEG